MFSLFSSKQSTSSINPSKTPIKVIDFNTTNKSTTKSNNNNNNNNTLSKNEPNIASISKSKFRLWPFTSSNEPAVTASANNNTTATIANTASDNITNIDKEVIAMKLVKDNKLTDNTNDIDNDNDDDEFIDIQVRKLSYAEIASLSVDESKKQLKSMKSDKKLGIDDIKVIEDNELGKSISDFEFKECYNKINKFDRLNYEELILNNNDYNNNTNQINNETANLINEDDELIVDLKQIKKHSKKFNKKLNKKKSYST